MSMREFVYRAARPDGTLIDGRLQASTREDAIRQLGARQLTLLSLSDHAGAVQTRSAGAQASGPGRFSSGRAPGFPDIHGMTTELSIMLKAGLPLDRALRVLIGMTRNALFVAVVEDLLKSVKAGKGLSQALLPHQALFGDFYINMVRSGEAGGQLSEVLGQLAEHLERMRALRESVVSALTYPAILVVVATLSVFLMLGFVVPQFESLFDDLGDGLPVPTRIIVSAGHFVAESGWMVLVGGSLLVGLMRRWSRTPEGAAWADQRLLNAPIFGDVVRKFEITRFARSMGTLLKNGVPIVTAIRIATETMGNTVLRASMGEIAPAIKRGGRMAEALEKAGLFTPLALNMIRLGEETGRLDEMLLEVARVHDGQVQTAVKRALQLVEPVLILLMGGIIALIIVSILMGILSVNDLAG